MLHVRPIERRLITPHSLVRGIAIHRFMDHTRATPQAIFSLCLVRIVRLRVNTSTAVLNVLSSTMFVCTWYLIAV